MSEQTQALRKLIKRLVAIGWHPIKVGYCKHGLAHLYYQKDKLIPCDMKQYYVATVYLCGGTTSGMAGAAEYRHVLHISEPKPTA